MSSERDARGSERDGLAGLTLYVAAIAGRPVDLSWHEESHGRSYSDGRRLCLARERSAEAWVDVTLQALLVRQGSFERRALQGVIGRPARARSYLACELARALQSQHAWLPRALLEHAAVAPLLAWRPLCESPSASLAHAQRHALAHIPAAWGTLLPSRVLAQGWTSGERSAEQPASGRPLSAATRPKPDHELDQSSVLEAFRAPIASGVGLLGRMLESLLDLQPSSGERAKAGQDGAADGRAHAGVVASTGARIVSARALPQSVPALGSTFSFRYPEWHEPAQRYRPDFVHVAEVDPHPDHARSDALPRAHASRALHKLLARLCLGYAAESHHAQGDDVVVDALVRLRVDLSSGHAGDPNIYRAHVRTRRELGVLLLLDISASTAERAADGVRVFDHQLGFALALTHALHACGDRVALYGFHSWGPKLVRVQRVLAFGERPEVRARERAANLAPVGYSRLGAAVRHGSATLRERAGTPQRLLVLISDAVAYDRGYERAYAAADTRRALAEARADNTAVVCLSIGASTQEEALSQVFGGACYLALPELRGSERALHGLFERAIAEASRRA